MDKQTNSKQDSNTETQPATILAYPPPPLQYINAADPNNLPPPIKDGVFYMFGQKISMDDAIIAPLETQGTTTKRLYPRGEYDHKKELKKINASILVNFLDLIDVLVRCPDTDKRIEKCNDLATLFINFHHLINELRPHQARETLRVWLTCQKKSRIEITQRLNKEMQKSAQILEEFKNFERNHPNEFIPTNNEQNLTLSSNIDKVSDQNHKEIPIDDILCDIIDESKIND